MVWCGRHRQSIINSLQDADISIRRRALDLLFAMCNSGNVREIVGELLTYLQVRAPLSMAILIINVIITTRFPARSKVRLQTSCSEGFPILPLDGLARSKQDRINCGHYCTIEIPPSSRCGAHGFPSTLAGTSSSRD